MDPRKGKEDLGQKVLRPCMGSECLKYSFNAGPKSLNAPVYHHSSSLDIHAFRLEVRAKLYSFESEFTLSSYFYFHLTLFSF